MDTPFSIKNVTFPNRLLNASGCWDTSSQELDDLLASGSGGIVSKSCLFEPYEGNPEPRVFLDRENKTSINSVGLANYGFQYYDDWGKSHPERKKPYIISIASKHRHLVPEIANKLKNCDLIEINISCPNILNQGIMGFDFESVRKFSDELFPSLNTNIPIGLKLPPYFNSENVSNLQWALSPHISKISYMCTINGMPNGYLLDENSTQAIQPRNGVGGVGGIPAKPFGLFNVREIKRKFPNMPVIGCGGIFSRKDVDDYLAVGADLVAIGTGVCMDGPSIFSKILEK